MCRIDFSQTLSGDEPNDTSQELRKFSSWVYKSVPNLFPLHSRAPVLHTDHVVQNWVMIILSIQNMRFAAKRTEKTDNHLAQNINTKIKDV
jgi:hypothetical protein